MTYQTAIKKWNQENELAVQLDIYSTGKTMRNVVHTFCENEGLTTLEDVHLDQNFRFYDFVESLIQLSDNQRKAYKSYLEQIMKAYTEAKNPIFVMNACNIIKTPSIANKVIVYLQIVRKLDPINITYEDRQQYERLINETCAPSKKSEYMKAFDNLKLNAILQDNKKNPLRKQIIKYTNSKFFLLYYPDYDIAKTFYYIQDKSDLLFDFSYVVSYKLKVQVFTMLISVLNGNDNRHDRRERFIIPLKKLYIYCVQNRIGDLEQLTDAQIDHFKESMDGNVGAKLETYMQIVDNTRQFLFLNAKATNWDANKWFLQRFVFKDGRCNPAREIKSISFGAIKDDENRAYFKLYMRYCIGITSKKTLQTIRGIFYDINAFLQFCDVQSIKVREIEERNIETYADEMNKKSIETATYNRGLISIARFLNYLFAKQILDRVPIQLGSYLKKTFTQHHNRVVQEETRKLIFDKLGQMPCDLRYIYLNVWATGLRISEVCSLKAGMYSWYINDAWIKIPQSKMKKEKSIIIPTNLYLLMKQYISDNSIKSQEYVFKNKAGKAYDAGTFTKRFKEELVKVGLQNYDYRAHDYRHTLATKLIQEYHAPIEVVRDYLGHRSSDMTRQYIDYTQNEINRKNEEYFEQHSLKWEDNE